MIEIKMADTHLNLIERFPVCEEQILELTETNSAFNTMAYEFNQVADELNQAEVLEVIRWRKRPRCYELAAAAPR